MSAIHFIQDGGLFTLIQAAYALLCVPVGIIVVFLAPKIPRKSVIISFVALEFPVLVLGAAGYVNALRLNSYQLAASPEQEAAFREQVALLAQQQWYIPVGLILFIAICLPLAFLRAKQ